MAKEKLYKAMVCQTVLLGRPDPNGKPDKDGKVPQLRFEPPIGKVFEFTESEIRQITAMAPMALRDPKNESVDFEEGVDQAGAAAAYQALTTGGAAGDAANVARAAAMGLHKLPTDHASDGSDVKIEAEEDEDL